LDYLDAHGIEANVRYLPFCLFPEKYRKFVQNFQQIVYDLHEWESAGEAWSSAEPQRQAEAPLSAPIDFFGHVEAHRVRAFARALEQLPADKRWSPSVRQTLDALEARAAGRQRLTVSLYGSPSVGLTLMRAAATRPALREVVSFEAFISSPAY